MKRGLKGLCLLLVLSGPTAWAAGVADSVLVAQAWVRQSPPNIPATGAFMTLKNTGAQEARLLGASNSASMTTELHTHLHEDGMLKMRQVSSITIKPGTSVAMSPGGYHIMMIDLKAPLKEGERVSFVLEFDDGSKKMLSLPVKRPGGGY